MNSRSYLGYSFEVRIREQSWFWNVSDANQRRGATGVAASELEAMTEVCAAIEEMRTERGAEEARANDPNISPIIAALEVLGWEKSLASLQRYLSSVCVENA
jgi:hypothetical protein